MKKSQHEPENPSGDTTRREFLETALVATSGLAVASMIPASALAQTPPAITKLQTIGQISSHGTGLLKGVIKIKNSTKNLPGWTIRPMMRYFEGYDQQIENPPVWPTDKTAPLPGPTLRVTVGERVELTMINQVKVDAFAGSIDQAETGASDGCDQATNATLDPPDKEWYPNTRGDTYPNCFHGSSTANMHFHGTHVSPDGYGDNVLVNVRPDPNLTDEEAIKRVEDVFKECKTDAAPPWSKVPATFRDWQAAAVKNYDLNAVWQGVRGPKTDADGNKESVLPYDNQLTPVNEHNIAAGYWPQYFVGVFPNCFKITEAAGHEMGQAPGTHWYHAHKHGSTSINLYNGLSGALIIEGDYDKDLSNIPNLNLKGTEKVLVVQQFTDLPDLERPVQNRVKVTVTNGSLVKAGANATTIQTAPTIEMKPGEIQLWRIVNAHVQITIAPNPAFTEPSGASKVLPTFRQIAQDGVQFSVENYNAQPLTTPVGTTPVIDPVDNKVNGTTYSLAPGGRIDILVKAPLLPTGVTYADYQMSGVVNLRVSGDPVQPAQNYPTDAQFPKMPDFLKANIPPPSIERTVTFGWEPYRVNFGPAADQSTHGVQDTTVDPPLKLINLPKDDVRINPDTKINIGKNRAPYWTLDNEQFREDKYYQTMILGDSEEWLLVNNTSVTHPFHIHVNPFQVVEVFDPNNKAYFNPDGTPKPWKNPNPVWQDVINIPAGLKKTVKKDPVPPANPTVNALMLGPDNKAIMPGWVRVRSRFVDFTGSYVLHCHILAHEDRGMMQLVRVIGKATPLKHH